jgi:Protein of unknown function (DUF3105)
MKPLLVIPLALGLLLAACTKKAATTDTNSATATIEGVKTFKTESSHVEGKIDYPQTPPVGGPHNPTWQNCGIYTSPLYNEYAVHSMEHGAVWVAYREGLAGDQLKLLQKAVEGRPYTLLSPVPDLRTPVVVTGWNVQLDLPAASDPRLKQFIQKYEQGGTAPEIGSPCSGGYGETT